MKISLHLLKKNIKYFSNKSTPSDNISFVKVNDIKGFGKKFNDEEMKKYLDPYGFLSSTEYKDVKEKVSEAPVKVEIKSDKEKLNENLKKLEDIEKIEDPMKKADEKSKNMPKEFGYKYSGKEPTRYGDWEVKGKCVDF